MSKALRFFIAGIIQGSLPDTTHPQTYREEIGALLQSAFPHCVVFDPVEQYPDSLSFDDTTASAAFFDLMDRAGKTDVLIAFVPEASMGTAIELWNAHHSGAVVVVVSRLRRNWVIRYLADAIVDDMDAFRHYIATGELKKLIEAKRGEPCG